MYVQNARAGFDRSARVEVGLERRGQCGASRGERTDHRFDQGGDRHGGGSEVGETVIGRGHGALPLSPVHGDGAKGGAWR